MQIHFDSYSDDFKTKLQQWAPECWSELRQILPQLPENITFHFNNQFLIESIGVGGFALSDNEIVLAAAVDKPFEELQKELRATIFHEGYHLAQGFIGSDKDYDMTALQNGVWEGAATVFEREFAGVDHVWGKYDDEFVKLWLPQVISLGTNWHETAAKWKFWDPETNTSNILYRLGTSIVDEAIKKSGLSICELVDKSAQEIIDISKVNT